MCAAQFVVILDLAIVNVALPAIQEDFGVSSSSLEWVVIAYGLTLGGGLLLGGRIADLFGRRATLAAGLLTFTGASLVAGLSGSLGVLVAARAVQGIGGALAVPAALSILTSTFAEGPERNRALGVFGAVGASAGSIGVVAGGALTSGPGWQWVFLINVPVGIVFAALVLGVIPAFERDSRPALDVPGAVTVTAGLVAIVFGINRSTEHGWTSAIVVGSLVIGALLLVAFVAIESRARQPLVPLSIFRHRTLTAAIVVSLLLGASFFSVIFQGTLFMQQALDYSPIHTGLAWLAATASSVVVAGVVAPRLVGRIGPARTLVIGQGVMALGLLRLASVSIDGSYWSRAVPCVPGVRHGDGRLAGRPPDRRVQWDRRVGQRPRRWALRDGPRDRRDHRHRCRRHAGHLPDQRGAGLRRRTCGRDDRGLPAGVGRVRAAQRDGRGRGRRAPATSRAAGVGPARRRTHGGHGRVRGRSRLTGPTRGPVPTGRCGGGPDAMLLEP